MKLDAEPESIQIGQPVRSYDFPDYLDMPGPCGDNVRGSFVEGIVERIIFDDDWKCRCYEIKIALSVYQRKPYVYDPPRTHVRIPVNGTRKSHGGIYRHVVSQPRDL